MAALKASGVDDNTLVIVSGDNGPWETKCNLTGSVGPFTGLWQKNEGEGERQCVCVCVRLCVLVCVCVCVCSPPRDLQTSASQHGFLTVRKSSDSKFQVFSIASISSSCAVANKKTCVLAGRQTPRPSSTVTITSCQSCYHHSAIIFLTSISTAIINTITHAYHQLSPPSCARFFIRAQSLQGGGGSSAKTTLWEGVHRVVGLARWPGKISPRVSNATVSSLDIVPTVLSLARIPLPADRVYDGHDIGPVLLDGNDTAGHVTLFHPNSGASGVPGKLDAVRWNSNGKQWKAVYVAIPSRRAH